MGRLFIQDGKINMEEKPNYTDAYLTKLHHDILTVMDEVDRVCRENNLRYYLFGGTCLGAIRHQGFIPWDDDLDIVMPRADFNRFLELTEGKGTVQSVLKDSFYLRWITTEKSYNQYFAKICLKDTLFQENKGAAAQNSGIFVDVFPIDYCKPYGKAIERKDGILQSLKSILYDKGAEKAKTGGSFKLFVIRVLSTLLSNRAIFKLMIAVIRPNKDKGSGYLTVYATPYPIKRMLVPESWYGEGREVLFGQRHYVCPTNAESVLKRLYGDDYMQLPPENKRKSHYPIRVVFSDGKEMVFEKTKNKVGYQDILD